MTGSIDKSLPCRVVRFGGGNERIGRTNRPFNEQSRLCNRGKPERRRTQNTLRQVSQR